MGVALFHADGETDGQDVAKSRFSQVKLNQINPYPANVENLVNS